MKFNEEFLSEKNNLGLEYKQVMSYQYRRRAPVRGKRVIRASAGRPYKGRVINDGPGEAPRPRKGRKAQAVGRALGGLIGAKFGAPGRAIGRGLGGLAGSAFTKLTGVGDYSATNLLMSSRSDGVPVMHSQGGSVRVQHVEYIGNISSTQAFTNTIYPIQPTNGNTFPWLSSMAVNFEQWRAHGIVFYFKSMSSDTQIASTVSLGQIILATEYNALAPGFTTEQQMLNSQWSCSTKPSQHVTHYIECASSQTPSLPLYCKGYNDALGDLRLYNLGNFQLATVGMQAPDHQTLGQLFVSYDIELLKPVLAPALDQQLPYSLTYNPVGSGDCTSTQLYGSTIAQFTQNTKGISQTISVGPGGTGLLYTLAEPEEAKAFLISLNWVYPLNTPANVPANPGSITYTNCILDPDMPQAVAYPASDQQMLFNFYVKVIDPYAPFGVTPVSGGGMNWVGNADLTVRCLPYNRSI